ncbi:TraX protein [Aerococcus vaginalis]
MTTEKRQALLFFALSLLFASLQLWRDSSTVTWWNHLLSIALPIVAMVFALNVKESKWRWSLIGLEIVLTLLMIWLAFVQ